MSEQAGNYDEFEELLDKIHKTPKVDNSSLSPMIRKLKQRKEHNVIETYFSLLKKAGAYEALATDELVDIAPQKHSLLNKECGKKFSHPVDEKYVPVLYQINQTWSCETRTKYYFLEKIPSKEEQMSDGRKGVTFLLDNPMPNGNQLVLLHFGKAENHVIINHCLMIDDEIRLSKQPTVLELNPTIGTKTREEASYQLEGMSDEDKNSFLNGISSFSDYCTNVDSSVVIIDTSTYLPVQREVFLDDGKYKAKIKLKTGCSYFALKVNTEDDLSLSDSEIAKCYLYGRGDFPQDIIKAAELLEEIGDAESQYLLAHIWLDERYDDVDSIADGIAYLEQAAQMGHTIAKAELIYYTMKLLCLISEGSNKDDIIERYHRRIENAVSTELPGALFLAAYVYEKGLFVEKNTEIAFSFYNQAAQANCTAAQARIDFDSMGNLSSRNDCQICFNKSVNQAGLADYYMGWFLADDPDVKVVTTDILYFYELAANSGVKSAIRELGEVYMYGNDYIEIDPAKAILWYEKLPDIDDETTVKLANYYLDGKGCTAGPESDAKAFHLLSQTTQKYKNGSAYNNLAWMYKTGRVGNSPDFVKAIELFIMAADLECASAFYHLGDIYEHGLGVETDRKKAWQYYKKGAEFGHKKCESIIAESPDSPESSANQVVTLLSDIQEQVAEINAGTKRMELKLDQVLKFVENDLSHYIAEAKQKLQGHAGDDDTAVEEFVRETSSFINQTLVSPDDLVKQETQQLQLLFGQAWDRLLPSSRTSLISAGVLWKSCARITKEDFDCSGVCISATSALEAELKRVFYTGLQEYLESKYGRPDAVNWESTFDIWPEKLLSFTRYDYKKALDKFFRGEQKWKPELGKGNSFTMGVLPFLFGKPEKFSNAKQEGLLQKHLSEYLSTIVVEKYARNPIIAFWDKDDKNCFVEKSERIRKDYRNKAAHIDVVSRQQAEGCYHQVVGKIGAYEYTSGVTGLIAELYEKLK